MKIVILISNSWQCIKPLTMHILFIYGWNRLALIMPWGNEYTNQMGEEIKKYNINRNLSGHLIKIVTYGQSICIVPICTEHILLDWIGQY